MTKYLLHTTNLNIVQVNVYIRKKYIQLQIQHSQKHFEFF